VTWFEDLSPCDYFGPPELAPHLRDVGWLERGRPFLVGPVDRRIYDCLLELRKDPWQPAVTPGLHACDLCQFDAEALGNANLFIPGIGLLYLCPELIVHYMNAHHYAPPPEFCEAVLACPPMRSMDYRRALLANGGRPLVRWAGAAEF